MITLLYLVLHCDYNNNFSSYILSLHDTAKRRLVFLWIGTCQWSYPTMAS